MTRELRPAGQQLSNHRPDITFGEIAGILWRRKAVLLLILIACLALAAFASHRMTPRWRADAEMVLVQRDTRSDAAKTVYAAPVIETVDTQMAMLQSVGMAQRTLEWLQSHSSKMNTPPAGKEWTITTLQKAVTITNPKETNVIQVSTEAASPGQAAQIADAVCHAFLQWKKELAQQQVRGIAQSLQIRSARAQGEMLAAERQEKLFKQKHQLTDVAAQEKFLLDQYQTQQAQEGDLQKEQESLNARLIAIGAKLKTKNVHLASGGVRDDALVTSLQSQLTQLEMDRADAAQKVTPFYPGVLPEFDAKIRDAKAHLSQAIHGILSGNLITLQSQGSLLNDYQETQVNAIDVAAKLAAVTRLRGQMHMQIVQMPQIDADYKQLVRNVDLTNALSSSLQSSLNAARLDAEIATGDVQITQTAIASAKPFRPNWPQNLALAGMVGLFLAGLAIILMEQGDRRVRVIADVQRLISAPVLGSLPVLPRAQMEALPAGSGGTQVMEAFRMTYANLLMTLHQSGHSGYLHSPVVLVTSALPGEGKTVTATHLARAIARCGKRTILVDADLRVPVQEGRASSERMSKQGLADVLRGMISLEEAMMTSEDKNLLILGRGRVDAGSADLVSLPQMERTLASLRGLADFVIVDAPACLDRADVFFLAPLVDCVLQVVGAGRVDELALRQAFEALAAAQPQMMSLFFNFSPEHRMTLMSGSAPRTEAPQSAPMGSLPAWDLAEKILLSENKTTKIIVQSLPNQERTVSLAHTHYSE